MGGGGVKIKMALDWDQSIQLMFITYLIIVTNCDIVSSLGTRNLVLSSIGSACSL